MPRYSRSGLGCGTWLSTRWARRESVTRAGTTSFRAGLSMRIKFVFLIQLIPPLFLSFLFSEWQVVGVVVVDHGTSRGSQVDDDMSERKKTDEENEKKQDTKKDEVK